MNHISHSRSNSHSKSHSPRAYQAIFILFILAIVLPVATIFAAVFALKSRDFGGFNVGCNVLNNEFEKSGLNDNEYGGPTIETDAFFIIATLDDVYPMVI